LSEPEKILLLTELWDVLGGGSENNPRSREFVEELDRRMEAYRQNTGAVTTWEEIKRKILREP
jgi:putative addiction module component (TIGR02574 family)